MTGNIPQFKTDEALWANSQHLLLPQKENGFETSPLVILFVFVELNIL